MAEPWEIQPGESSKAFEAFVTYRDMEKPRSIRTVAQTLSKSSTMRQQMSAMARA